jgi:Co/Zn/Cd efflux system component
MKKSVFNVSKMDCPSEEQLIRMKLDSISNIKELDFDIPNRQVTVYHEGDIETINYAIQELNLSSKLLNSEETMHIVSSTQRNKEKQLLWVVLIINFSLFVLEIITGFISKSMGLIADSLDMLADAIVYGLSLFAIGRLATTKKQVAKISGYFQLGLALFGLAEVIRRFLGYEDVPAFQTMIFISLFALSGNAVSLYLLQKSKSDEAHMQASVIFTSNDVLANIGVIVAGIAVYFTHSKMPDLIVGSIVFLLVAKGAFRILKLAK